MNIDLKMEVKKMIADLKQSKEENEGLFNKDGYNNRTLKILERIVIEEELKNYN